MSIGREEVKRLPPNLHYWERFALYHVMILGGHLMTERDPLLQERQKTHGSFVDNALVWNALHQAFYGAQPTKANTTQVAALNMIFMKLARVASTPWVKDHWDDIAGYAKLGSEACD